MANFWQDRRVFVTGCTGLVGAWTVRALLERGAHVVGLVRDRVTGSELVRSGLVERIDVVLGCLEDPYLLERALAEYEIQTVFHLAAQTIVGIANRSPLSTFESNIKGTWCLLEAARRCGFNPDVIVASSDKAYGEQSELPYTEDAPLQGRHPYDASKSCADIIALTYHHTYRMPVCVTRCGNFYGGGDLNWNRLVPGTIRSILRGQRPVIRSDGTLIRDYFYVKDGAEAYLHLAQCLASRPGELAGHAFNFSNEIQVTALGMVQHILQRMGSSLKPDIRNEARNEIAHQYLSAAKARAMLDWRPRFELNAALDETVAWYRQFLGGAAGPWAWPLELWHGEGAIGGMKPTPERVLVTGGTGFIGAALVRALVAAGHEVHLISRSAGPSPRLIDVQDRCVTHQANLLDPVAVREVVQECAPEIIYHLAAVGVSAGLRFDRANLLRTNVLGTANLLEAMEGRFYRSLVYAGTGAEYGPSSEPIIEEAPLRPSSDYAVAKAAGALLCQTEARRGWPVAIVRIFGAFGPGEAPQRLIPYVMGCCLRGEVAKVTSGVQRRDWVYIDDVVELLQLAAHTPKAAGQVLHAATGRDQTVRQVVEMILEVAGSSTRVIYGAESLRPGESERYLADICRTRALTGWQPHVDLRTGIERTWNWFRTNEPEPLLRRAV